MVNDDLACETSSNGIVRECVRDGVLDGADCQSAAVIIACTKAYYEKLILADLILISWKHLLYRNSLRPLLQPLSLLL